MKLTEFSIRNPLLIAAVTIAATIFGLFAYTSLGVAITPNINFPSVVVTTIYPGADPETVETTISNPIEDALATLPNIEANGLTSISTQGVSTVVVQFSAGANPDLVSVDVERVVSAVRGRLPPDVEAPSVSKIDFNAFGVATVIYSGPQSPSELQDFAENVLQKELNALPGVGSAGIRSGIAREVQVKVDQTALRARGLSINQVVGTLQASQLEVPAGVINQGSRDLSVYFDALASSPADLESIVLAQTPGGTVHLRDVATVENSTRKRDALVRVNGQEGIALVIVKLANANTISVVAEVRQAIARLQPRLPAGAQLNVVTDSARYTQKSFDTVQHALLEAIVMTGVILLLFLHTWRSTAIVLVSIPTSLLVTLAVMSGLGYNLNLITMLALTLCVGILVDDSIVVLENIARHLGMGKTPVTAALDGRSEIGLAALTITLVDVVVYAPMAIVLTGLSAQFLRPFAITIATATLTSLLVSFTLVPLLASRMLRHETDGRGPLARFGRRWDRGFGWLEQRYEWLLQFSLPHRWWVIAVGLLTFAAGISLFFLGFIKTDFFPSGDQSEINITLTMPPSTSLEATDRAALQAERLLRGHPEVETVYSVVGSVGGIFGASTGHNTAQITALLVPPHDRHVTSAALGEELRGSFMSTIPEVQVQIGMPNAFGFSGFGGQPVQILVQGPDPATVNRLAAQVEQAVRAVPGAISVQNSNANRQTQIRARIDWARAADLGVSPQSAGAALRASIDGFRSNFTQLHQPGKAAIDIRVVDANANVATLDDIRRLPVSGNGGVVQLDQFTTLQEVTIPTRISRVNRLRSVTIGAEAGEGYLIGDLQNAIQRTIQGLDVPAGYAVTYAGQGAQNSQIFGEIFKALGIAILLMYMLMMVLFGSLTLPLAVLMSVPLAVVGALGAMAITQTPFTLFSLLGFAVLVGLVGKNAILLVDFTEILRVRGYERHAALLEAGPTRLRPIVMTTMSVIAALVPIVVGLEEGSELMKAAGVVLIGGLLTSTLLTLVFVPAMYTLFDDLEARVARLYRRLSRQPEPSPPRANLALPPAVAGGSD